jgi:hypothetical protein
MVVMCLITSLIAGPAMKALLSSEVAINPLVGTETIQNSKAES